ncbi:MAG TPA: heme lyase CcmF/NrfE family subunit [Longimicrobiaceae bacterium]|nr:heme lyase CcmF/NrfE family subunit [Longimicrobiaceae bacterium]
MTRLLGDLAVAAALALALGGALASFWGGGERPWALRHAKRFALLVFGCLSVATAAMVYALVSHDFSVGYVAQVGSRSTPLLYTVISLWGALEGSILFWGWVLALYTALVAVGAPDSLGTLKRYALGTLMAVGCFFYLLLVGPASPFLPVSPVPADGPGPNPLLQNHPLMAVHPPLLYLGYVGMTVPFAFAVGSLLARRDDLAWIRVTRRWTLTAWLFLSLAIVAGMWWSYEVLGWGGYWAWDPVENASFMPWLTATAFLHSVLVQERRGMLKLWNASLIISTFLLTILGTFLTRSGVLSSVHAFAEGPIGYYFLGFIAVVLVASLALLAGRSPQLKSDGRLDSVASRETAFLFNNLLLTAFTFTVLLGTLFPLVAEALRGVKLSVGGPFFNRMTLPLCVALLFLVGVGPALPWRAARADELRRKLLAPAAALVLTVVLCVAFRVPSVYGVLAFGFGAFAFTTNAQEFVQGAAARMRSGGERPWTALGRLVAANRHRYGGYVAHLGVVALAVGIAASSTFRAEQEQTLRPGESMRAGPFELRLERLWSADEPQRFVVGADVRVFRGGRDLGVMDPRLNFYRVRNEPVPTPAVRSRLTDLYLNLMAFERDGSTATLSVVREPLVSWIWLGGGIVALGALIALWPQRRKRPPARPAAPAPRPAPQPRELVEAGGD